MLGFCFVRVVKPISFIFRCRSLSSTCDILLMSKSRIGFSSTFPPSWWRRSQNLNWSINLIYKTGSNKKVTSLFDSRARISSNVRSLELRSCQFLSWTNSILSAVFWAARVVLLFLFTFAYFRDNLLTSDWPEVMYLATSLAEMYCRDLMVRLLDTDLVRVSVAEEVEISHVNVYFLFTQGQISVSVNIWLIIRTAIGTTTWGVSF